MTSSFPWSGPTVVSRSVQGAVAQERGAGGVRRGDAADEDLDESEGGDDLLREDQVIAINVELTPDPRPLTLDPEPDDRVA